MGQCEKRWQVEVALARASQVVWKEVERSKPQPPVQKLIREGQCAVTTCNRTSSLKIMGKSKRGKSI